MEVNICPHYDLNSYMDKEGRFIIYCMKCPESVEV